MFGDAFVYSNCKQTRAPFLRHLGVGSLILFGSKLAGRFVLDTVFVVADAQPWNPAGHDELQDAFAVCTAASLLSETTACGAGSPGSAVCAPAPQLTFYRGATYEHPVAGMYSFVPARLASDADLRFARPAFPSEPPIPGTPVNPAFGRGARGARATYSPEEVQWVWSRAREATLEAGCVLGVQFDTPTGI